MRLRVITTAAITVVLASGVASNVRATPESRTPPHCDVERRAVAHHAGQAILKTQPRNGPVVCGMFTGFAGSEGKVEVTNTGAVMFVPAATPIDPTTMGTLCRDTQPQIEPRPPVTPPAAFCEPGPQSMLTPGGIAVSKDEGATWQFVMPMGMTWVNDDNDAFVDRTTGRFFASYIGADPAGQTPTDQGRPVPTAVTANNPGLANLVTSGDDGATWQYGQACCEISDEGAFTAGPVPTGDANLLDQLTSDYPHVTYYCWQASQDVPPQPPARFCSKSRDAGATWEPVAFAGRGVVPVHTDVCATPGSIPPSTAFSGGTQPTDEAAGMPQVDPTTGWLYMVVACAPDRDSPVKYYVAVSTDEARTWPIANEISHPGELRIDSTGNLYLLRSPGSDAAACGTSGTIACATELLLSTSTDHGASWSAERNVLAPQAAWFEKEDSALYGGENGGWSCCVNWFYDVKEPGHVAIAYYGHTRAKPEADRSVDGYITETRNALDAEPVFWSAATNDPKRPLKFDIGFPKGGNGQQTNSMGVDIGIDGSSWAAFTEDCATDPAFTDTCEETHNSLPGFAGRLWWRKAY